MASITLLLLALPAAFAAGHEPTCSDVKGAYKQAECCGADGSKELSSEAQATLSKMLEPDAVCFTGCSPYTEPPFPTWSRMVADMAKECVLLVHLGDTKSGGAPCNDTLMAGPLRVMIDTGVPTLFSMGDNEATDCHRSATRADLTSMGGVVGSNGEGSPIVPAEFYTAEGARTHLINEFYSDITTDLTGTLPVNTQSMDCPFNVMVTIANMLISTIELPGSNSGLNDETNMDIIDPIESHQMMYNRSMGCNLIWLDKTAEEAVAQGLKAVVIGFQARWWDSSTRQGPSNDAYAPFWEKMNEVVAAHPDIMFYTIHADSHYWITFSPNRALSNWVNVMVEGSTRALTSYAKVTVDSEHYLDPITVKEVHVKMNEDDIALGY